MSDINTITFNIDDDTFQVVNGRLLIWKNLPDHEPDFDLAMEDVKRLILASSFLRTDSS